MQVKDRYHYGHIHTATEEYWYINEGDETVWRMPFRMEHLADDEPPPELREQYESLIGWHSGMERQDVPNIVEAVADGDCAFDQPCKFGYRVEDYAVYCHNSGWLYAPRKCHKCSLIGNEHEDCERHATCKGFSPNGRMPVPDVRS